METTPPTRPAAVELRCRVCARRIRKPARGVPRSDLVRCVECADEALLRSFGIDPAAARAAWEREQRRRRRCSRCGGRADLDDARATDGELVCATCRAADMELRRSPDAEEERPRPRPAVAAVDAAAALRRACAHAALFLVGCAAFARTLLGADLAVSALVGAVAAWVGGRMVHASSPGAPPSATPPPPGAR